MISPNNKTNLLFPINDPPHNINNKCEEGATWATLPKAPRHVEPFPNLATYKERQITR